MLFKVMRDHMGDKWYNKGDDREANKHDVKHLVPNVLIPEDEFKAAEQAAADDEKTGNTKPAGKKTGRKPKGDK